MQSKTLEIIRRNLSKISEELSGYEKAVFRRVLHCRTEAVPFLYTHCDCCGHSHPVYLSCKNRMCPLCNGAATVKWIAMREAELLPTGYFLLTFTIPFRLRPLFLANKKICYNLLFKAMSRVLLKGIETNNRKFHGMGGFFAILHTWDQRRNYHPHLHTVVPAGALSKDKTTWVPSSKTFLLPVKKLSAEFRDKLLFYLRKEDESGSLVIPESIIDLRVLLKELNRIPWVVHSQAPGKGKDNPAMMIRYLSRYVNKSAVSDKQIQKIENGMVHLRYVDRQKKKAKTEILSEELFLQRLVLHILPKGFKKIRFYGFMANRYRANMLALCRMLMGVPLAKQESIDKESILNDVPFLFWKYFKVDITRCIKCGVGHLSYSRSSGYG